MWQWVVSPERFGGLMLRCSSLVLGLLLPVSAFGASWTCVSPGTGEVTRNQLLVHWDGSTRISVEVENQGGPSVDFLRDESLFSVYRPQATPAANRRIFFKQPRGGTSDALVDYNVRRLAVSLGSSSLRMVVTYTNPHDGSWDRVFRCSSK